MKKKAYYLSLLMWFKMTVTCFQTWLAIIEVLWGNNTDQLVEQSYEWEPGNQHNWLQQITSNC